MVRDAEPPRAPGHTLPVAFRPVRVDELDTPVPTVDFDAVERNIARRQGYCDEHGFDFRPHVKTHKVPELARMQLDAGAVGITCQKLGEAEVMADAGIARRRSTASPRSTAMWT